MKWSDISRKPAAKVLRQFAAAWLVFFLAAGVYQYLTGNPRSGAALALAAVLAGVWGLIKPGAVRWLFAASMALAFPISWCVTQILLLVMFYGILTPVAVVFRIRGRDLLGRKRGADGPSCWKPKKTPADLRSYFRQY